MMNPDSRSWPAKALLWICILLLAPLCPGATQAATKIRFNRDVRPILSDNCFQCHGPDAAARKGDLRLDIREDALAQDAFDPGNPGHSSLIARILESDPDERMPPPKTHKRVSPDELEILRSWIAQGAEYEPHWSFIPVRKPQPPALPEISAHAANEIDRFVLARLADENLSPAPPADRHTLIRRVSLDLTGLPPSPEEVDAFVEDTAPLEAAYEKVVDRLLASPRYGEHIAYYWLDAARYADSDGYESDPLRTMWPWRDWVIEKFNDNLPYDRFIVEQLAGDLLESPTLRQKLATGFNRNHRLNNEGGILPEEWIVEYVCDRAETTAILFLGLTWNCARCHDHKYDPVTMRDYYQLFAFFNTLDEKGSAGGAKGAPPMMEVPALEHLEEYDELQRQLEPLETRFKQLINTAEFNSAHADWLKTIESNEEARKKLPGNLGKTACSKWKAEHKTLAQDHFLKFIYAPADLQREFRPVNKRFAELKRTGAKVMVMQDMAEPRPSHILERGAYNQPRDTVTANTPGFLPAMNRSLPRNRLGLAQWLVDPRNPLTARVTVNRLWERFFGVGIVKTQEDFGVQGEPPSHPELLDWLAAEFVESGWDLKSLQKRIVTSNTYRQSSNTSRKIAALDPENRLLARGPRFRLSAPVIRDQALAAGGLLVEKIGGPPVKPYQPEGLWKEIIKGRVEYVPDTGDKLYRRSLYTLWRRAVNPPLMTLLDANLRDTCDVGQSRTNTPLQALLLMNDVTFVEAARGLATRMLRGGDDSDAARATLGMRLITGRPPSPEELQILTSELTSQRAHYRANPEAAEKLIHVGQSTSDPALDPIELAAHTALARVLLNLDETLTKQ